jgi:hypothetical protein
MQNLISSLGRFMKSALLDPQLSGGSEAAWNCRSMTITDTSLWFEPTNLVNSCMDTAQAHTVLLSTL